MRAWISRLITEQLHPLVNEKFKAVMSQLSNEAYNMRATATSIVRNLPSKVDYEWLRHEMAELRISNENLRHEVMGARDFHHLVEMRLAKVETKVENTINGESK